jgi:tRNA (guanine37-N1)-methyltransferase
MVPDVLLSGNHAQIELWRRRESLIRTYKRRPDLFKKLELSAEDKKFLDEIKQEEI